VKNRLKLRRLVTAVFMQRMIAQKVDFVK
jgi:hypothetical protein